MKQAQAAWALLTAVFTICGTVVICTSSDEAAPFAFTCLVVGIIGWLTLASMILVDRSE